MIDILKIVIMHSSNFPLINTIFHRIFSQSISQARLKGIYRMVSNVPNMLFENLKFEPSIPRYGTVGQFKIPLFLFC